MSLSGRGGDTAKHRGSPGQQEQVTERAKATCERHRNRGRHRGRRSSDPNLRFHDMTEKAGVMLVDWFTQILWEVAADYKTVTVT